MLELRGLTPETAEAWDSFVARHPAGTVFHRAGWAAVMRRAYGHTTHFTLASEAGEIKGVLPLVEIKSRIFGHALISNAFQVAGGPLAVDEDTRRTLLAESERIGRYVGAAYVELRDTAGGDGWIAKDDLYAGFAREIDTDEAKNLLQIPRKQRAVVRKAIEGSLRITIDKNLDTFFALYARTVRDHGTPVFPKRFLAAVLDTFSDNVDILTVWRDRYPLASVCSYYFRDRVYPYYTGSDPLARECGANDLMYWKLMRHAVSRGCRVFDFGRSKVGTGPYAFKKNWGFEPRPIAHQYRLIRRDTLPNLNPSNPRFATLIEIWRHLPLPLANAVSPFISRNLG